MTDMQAFALFLFACLITYALRKTHPDWKGLRHDPIDRAVAEVEARAVSQKAGTGVQRPDGGVARVLRRVK